MEVHARLEQSACGEPSAEMSAASLEDLAAKTAAASQRQHTYATSGDARVQLGLVQQLERQLQAGACDQVKSASHAVMLSVVALVESGCSHSVRQLFSMCHALALLASLELPCTPDVQPSVLLLLHHWQLLQHVAEDLFSVHAP